MCQIFNGTFCLNPCLFTPPIFHVKSSQMLENKDIGKIDAIMDDLSNLPKGDKVAVSNFKDRARMIVTKIFGEDSDYVRKINKIQFFPLTVLRDFDRSKDDKAWESGKSRMSNLLKVMKEEIVEFPIANNRTSLGENKKYSNRVFIIHGHDNEMKESVARTLDKLKLEPIILHEQPSKGSTIIEKINMYSDVGFAIALLSPDDCGYPKNKLDEIRSRARQNVIFELGFFIGKLGRNHVLTLYKKDDNLEFPSDYEGVVYVQYDKKGAWRFELLKELRGCGYDVDANALI